MVKIGIVGNRDFKKPDVVIEKLNQFYEIFRFSKEFIIVSGEADPKSEETKDGNVDQIAKRWAIEYGKIYNNVKYNGHPPKAKNKEEFFKRNKEIAIEVNLGVGFINRGQYRSGTWNTIKHMTEKPLFNTFFIFNEDGSEWEFSEYPDWLKNRLTKKDNRVSLLENKEININKR